MHELDRRALMRLALGASALVAPCYESRAVQFQGVIDIDDFGAAGDGVTDDTIAFQAAMAQWQRFGGTLRLGAGKVYALGPFSRSGDIFVLYDLRNAALDGNGATIRLRTSGLKTKIFLFRFVGFRTLTISNLMVNCEGGDNAIEWQGAYGFIFDGTSQAYGRDLLMHGVTVRNAISLLWVAGGISKIAKIVLRKCRAERCYYGAVFEENGDDADLEFESLNCRRAYFPYGVNRHRVAVTVAHDGTSPGADACILIKRYDLDTSNISVVAQFLGTSFPWRYAAKLEFQPTSVGNATIDGISLVLLMFPKTIPQSLTAVGLNIVNDPGISGARSISNLNIKLTGPRGWRAKIENAASGLSNLKIDAEVSKGVSLISVGEHKASITIKKT